MTHIFVVAPTMNRTVDGNILEHAFEYATLAYRATLMWTRIAPGVKRAVKLEDTDFNPADDDYLFIAIFEGANGPNSVFGHISPICWGHDHTIIGLAISM